MLTWLYYHARWLYKFLSSYAYEMNCEIEETCAEVRRKIKAFEEQEKINELIHLKKYKEVGTSHKKLTEPEKGLKRLRIWRK